MTKEAEAVHKSLMAVMKGGRVKRYHAETLIGHQTVADHSWGVAMLVNTLWPDASKNFILAAIYHDTAEGEIGDIPSPTKRIINEATPVLENWEKSFQNRTNTNHEVNLTKMEKEQLKIVDYLELILFCQHQCNLGNNHIKAVGRAGIEYVEALLEKNPDILSQESYILTTIILSS